MHHPIFLAYGAILLGLVGVAEYRGWTMTHVNELKVAPKSIRDNPGAYRSHYAGFFRYNGGK
jgi:hypothetical protein